jgi:ABC-type tungstate transport system substrate-binding protein
VTVEQYKIRFLSVVLGVWAVVIGAALYVYLFRNGPLPDPVLLGIPTGTWLAVFPPLPRAREVTDGAA